MFNPFGMNSARQGFGQQGSNQPYDFKGLESRLGKIETGIAGLTDQFKNFKIPGQDTVDPAYTGNTTPNPLTPTEPPGGIQSLPTPSPGIISPTEPPGGPDVPIGGPGIIDPNFSPYQRNEDLDLTNRSGIMQEYSNYLQGGMGSRMHTADSRLGMQFMGEEMAPGSSTGFGDFRKFLGTYGIGDRLTNPMQQQSLKAAPPQTNWDTSGPGMTPLPSPPGGLGIQPPVNPYAPSNPVFGRSPPPGGLGAGIGALTGPTQ